MRLKTFLNTFIVATVFFILGFVFGSLYWQYLRPVNLYNTGISDEEYIRIAKYTSVAREFLEEYPEAKAYVDRSGLLAVDFRVDKLTANEDDKCKYIRIRIFINPRNNRPGYIFLDCSGKIEKTTKYLKTEK